MIDQIEHIVVVMMENRSFDHMLGYLSMPQWRLGEAGDAESMVDGLPEGGCTVTWNGQSYTSYPLGATTLPALHSDPDHSGIGVAWQAADPARYVATFAKKLAKQGVSPGDPGLVMGYLTAAEVPVYDFLAREFCVCDKWFCSVPGATWPNRMFAVAGTSGGETDIPPTLLEGAFGHVKTVFRHLDRLGVSWRWYSSDPSLLRAFDSWYRLDDSLDRFAYFDQWTERQSTNFLTDAGAGTLPSVSWVDPNFFRLPGLLDSPMAPEDDHPPHDVMLGQKFIHVVYEALRTSPCWETTLLMITYDEHGGFFDHVPPPAPFGPRVPAFLVSPWVEPGVPCHVVLEHTGIIKTILSRFGDGVALEEMGPRVYYANDVSSMLTRTTARDGPPIADAGGAALTDDDLEVHYLAWPGSTIQRTLEILDRKNAELVELQEQLLTIYVHLRGVLPQGIARWVSRVTRLVRPLAVLVRRLLSKAHGAVPKRWRPIPDRQP